ncbi:MAG: hypothetical protein IJV40_09965 [Oscillospiraceae bacterium]|nr:hypothetical protein [Oscillospiraceae bacterium]
MNKTLVTPIGEFSSQIETIQGKSIEGYLGVPYARAGSEFYRVKKGLILLNPIIGLIIGLVLGAALPSPIKAISYVLRNLGEGLMYLIPLAY